MASLKLTKSTSARGRTAASPLVCGNTPLHRNFHLCPFSSITSLFYILFVHRRHRLRFSPITRYLFVRAAPSCINFLHWSVDRRTRPITQPVSALALRTPPIFSTTCSSQVLFSHPSIALEGLSTSFSHSLQLHTAMKLRQILLTLVSSTTFISALALPPSSHPLRDDPKFKSWLDNRRRKGKDKGMPKYFQEPGGSELGNHYDSRFYSGIDTYENKRDTQLHMLRAYFTFFSEASMETWLAHGTLLGWWWNGKVRILLTARATPKIANETSRCYHGTGTLIPRFPAPHSLTWANTIIRQCTITLRSMIQI